MALQQLEWAIAGNGRLDALSPLDRLRIAPSFEEALRNAPTALARLPLYKAAKVRAGCARPKLIGENDPRPLENRILQLMGKPELR